MRRPPEVLEPDQVRALIRAADGDGDADVRNRALVTLLYRAALRSAEVLALRPSDISPAGVVHVRAGKGGKSGRVKVNGAAMAILREWIERRARLDLPADAPLFCALHSTRRGGGRGGGRLDTSYLRRLIPRLARRAGIESRVHTHSMRHSRARELAEAGTPLHVIRDCLRHSSVGVTDAYLRRIGSADVLDAMDDDWQP